MALRKGEMVDVILRGPAGGWSKGSRGAFPTDYVDFINAETTLVGSSIAPKASTGLSTPAFQSTGFPLESSAQILMTRSLLDLSLVEKSKNPKSDVLADPFADLPLSTPSASQPGKADPFVIGGSSTIDQILKPTPVSTLASVVKSVATPATTISEILPAPAAVSAATQPVKPMAPEPKARATLVKVKYSRVAAGPTELSILVGDTLLVRDTSAKEWWYGASITAPAKAGYFPSNYVEVVAENLNKASLQSPPSNASKATDAARAVASAALAIASQKDKITFDTSFEISVEATPGVAGDVSIPEATDELPSACRKAGLTGSRFVYNKLSKSELVPSWQLQPFLDFFTEPYSFSNKEQLLGQPAVQRLNTTLDCIVSASKMVDSSLELGSESQRAIFQKFMGAIKDTQDICRALPPRADDSVRFYTFLVSFMVRVRALRVGDYLILPAFWVDDQNFEHCVLCLISKDKEETSNNYTLTLVNGSTAVNSGIEYHPPSVDPVTGEAKRKVAITFRNISEERMQNTSFW
jgi:hypothetical protein